MPNTAFHSDLTFCTIECREANVLWSSSQLCDTSLEHPTLRYLYCGHEKCLSMALYLWLVSWVEFLHGLGNNFVGTEHFQNFFCDFIRNYNLRRNTVLHKLWRNRANTKLKCWRGNLNLEIVILLFFLSFIYYKLLYFTRKLTVPQPLLLARKTI
jgi:hypothetical protein